MKKYSQHLFILLSLISGTLLCIPGCTKYGKGFLSPFSQYSISEFTIIRGRISTSNSINGDGSSVPLHIRWTHIYDSTGQVVDDIFKKKYEVGIWTAAYNALVDTTYNSIFAKRSTDSLPPIVVNESNGTLVANSATYFLPTGTYTMDLELSNVAGTESLTKAMTIHIMDGKQVELSPETGNFSNSLALVGNAAAAKTVFNGENNPYDSIVLTRIADTPNVFILKITDRNGVPFNPRTGELTKRPNTGLDPVPPFLQNLQDYAPDTYVATDSAISIHFPLVPFPINSLGNGYNMYYKIRSDAVHIDSTSTWSANSEGVYYQGSSDPHFLGVYPDDQYNSYIRIPLRIQYAGSYELAIKVLNLEHR